MVEGFLGQVIKLGSPALIAPMRNRICFASSPVGDALELLAEYCLGYIDVPDSDEFHIVLSADFVYSFLKGNCSRRATSKGKTP